MSKPNYIVSLSGGKDSTAMLLMMLERKEPIHSVVFYDTCWEFPEMYNHLIGLEKYIRETFIKNFRITRLSYHRSFEEMLYRYGWPSISGWWCKKTKINTMDKYSNAIENAVQCIGMAADEPSRQTQTGPTPKRYPLAEWGIDEAQALEYCKKKGFGWGGLYDVFHRVSCRYCPERGIGGTRLLRNYYPKYWDDILHMTQYIERNQGYVHSKTPEQLDQRFAEEDRQMKIFPRIGSGVRGTELEAI